MRMECSLEHEAWRQVRDHAAVGYPEEVCGILLGGRMGQGRIARARPARNLASGDRRRRYLLDPGEFLQTDQWAEKQGLSVCGFYHSHPDHPAVPSHHDLAAAWPGYLYLIVGVEAGGLREVRAWSLDAEGNSFEEIGVQCPGARLVDEGPSHSAIRP